MLFLFLSLWCVCFKTQFNLLVHKTSMHMGLHHLLLPKANSSIRYLCLKQNLFCSSATSCMDERDDEVSTAVALALAANNTQPLSRRTRQKSENHFGAQGLTDGG